jgi:hypothetical protein
MEAERYISAHSPIREEKSVKLVRQTLEGCGGGEAAKTGGEARAGRVPMDVGDVSR